MDKALTSPGGGLVFTSPSGSRAGIFLMCFFFWKLSPQVSRLDLVPIFLLIVPIFLLIFLQDMLYEKLLPVIL